jgi:hypothetical protein
METARNLSLEMQVSCMVPDELYEELTDHFSKSDVSSMIELKVPRTRFRSAETPILLAVITASATALAALITGLSAVVKQREAKKIVIRGKCGESLEFPIGISDDEIRQLLDVLKEMEQPRICIPDD